MILTNPGRVGFKSSPWRVTLRCSPKQLHQSYGDHRRDKRWPLLLTVLGVISLVDVWSGHFRQIRNGSSVHLRSKGNINYNPSIHPAIGWDCPIILLYIQWCRIMRTRWVTFVVSRLSAYAPLGHVSSKKQVQRFDPTSSCQETFCNF